MLNEKSLVDQNEVHDDEPNARVSTPAAGHAQGEELHLENTGICPTSIHATTFADAAAATRVRRLPRRRRQS